MASDFITKSLLNVERLKLLRDLALIDNNFETVYDRLTKFASQIIGVPVSLVSMVASDYQFFKSHVGLPEPWKSRRRTPLSHSFCQHVVMQNKALIVTDAREHPLVKNNLAIPDLNVIGYLGIPLTMSNGSSLGSFCVIDGEPHEWTDTEIAIMEELASILILEFETRAKVNMRLQTQDDLKMVQDSIENLIKDTDTTQSQADILEQIKQLRQTYALNPVK